MFLSRYASISQNTFEFLNVDENCKEYLHEFFVKPSKVNHEETSESSNYCFITPVPFDLDWQKCDMFPLSGNNFSDKRYSFPVELFKVLDVYYREKNAPSFRQVLEIIKSNEYNFSCVPSSLQAFIPLCFDNSLLQQQVDTLLKGNDKFIDSYLSTKTAERLQQNISNSSQADTRARISFFDRRQASLCN